MQEQLCLISSHSYSLHLVLTPLILQLFTAVTCQFFKGCSQHHSAGDFSSVGSLILCIKLTTITLGP